MTVGNHWGHVGGCLQHLEQRSVHPFGLAVALRVECRCMRLVNAR